MKIGYIDEKIVNLDQLIIDLQYLKMHLDDLEDAREDRDRDEIKDIEDDIENCITVLIENPVLEWIVLEWIKKNQ